MTNDLNTFWSGTARPAEKLGPRNYTAEIWLVRRDTSELIETFDAPGTTDTNAMTNGLKLAKQKAHTRGMPADWKTRKAPAGALIV